MGIEHLGMLDVTETAALYRTCDIGVALTVSAHPSYLPLELMACGTPVVAFDNPAGYWVLEDGRNARLCRRTVTGLLGALDSLVVDPGARARLAGEGIRTIDAHFSDWEATGSRFADILADPEGTSRRGPAVGLDDHSR
jgi:glycosyltransferase involved in cell wall biosynthesis